VNSKSLLIAVQISQSKQTKSELCNLEGKKLKYEGFEKVRGGKRKFHNALVFTTQYNAKEH
jgi:hypothetical protein